MGERLTEFCHAMMSYVRSPENTDQLRKVPDKSFFERAYLFVSG